MTFNLTFFGENQSRSTSHQLLFVVEAVSLNSGDLQFVLLDDFLQRSVQLLLLLLEELLLLKSHTEEENRCEETTQVLQKGGSQEPRGTPL